MSLVTPLHFSCVQPLFYRGSYPKAINLPFLKTLRLKYIISLTQDPIEKDPIIASFCKEEGITPIHIVCQTEKKKSKDTPKIKRKKKPVPIEYDVVVECVRFLIDSNHYPCYIHCSNVEVTSLVIACIRKLSYWSTVSIFNEYMTYTSSINIHERNFIENFNLEIDIQGVSPSDKVSWMIVRSKQNGKTNATPKRVPVSGGQPDITTPKETVPSLTFHSN